MRGVRFSAGVVGIPAQLDQARALRRALPSEVYLWVNAAEGYRYSEPEIAAWEAIDALFRVSVEPHASRGLPCRTGEQVISVFGDGTVPRCHFVPEPLGNLYDGSFRAALGPRPRDRRSVPWHRAGPRTAARRADRAGGPRRRRSQVCGRKGPDRGGRGFHPP